MTEKSFARGDRVTVFGVGELCVRRVVFPDGSGTQTDFRECEPCVERLGTVVGLRPFGHLYCVHLDAEPDGVDRWWSVHQLERFGG